MYILISVVFVTVWTILSVRSYFAKKNICGQIALVTGGANGLGQQICVRLAKVGCNVAIADVDLAGAQKTAESLIKVGVQAKAYKVDVSNYAEITQLKELILVDFGEVDILVNNAGLISYKTIFDQSPEELERLTKVNLNSVMLMTKCFLKNMIRNQRGHIATISSIQGIYPFPHSLSYCSTKFGVTGFMLGLVEYLRQEKLSGKIHATCIHPHVIATNQEVISAVNPRYVNLKPEHVAKSVVNAILRNQRSVTVPFYFEYGIKFFNMNPFWVQNFIRDYIIKESSFMASKTKTTSKIA